MRRIGTINPKKRVLYLAVISIVAIFMATGYSILTERLTIKGSTNLYASENYLWKKILNDYGVNTNSGLMENEYENNKYSYSGTSPNNYITFNGNEVWRILSIENDNTVKIAKLNSNINIKYDESNTEETDDNYYCVELGTEGCNAWHQRSVINNKSYRGEVLHNSSINTYLNTTFYNALDATSKEYIVNHDFTIGSVTEEAVYSNDINRLLEYDNSDTWNGRVGVLGFTDFLGSYLEGESFIPSSVSNSKILWLMNPVYDSNTKVWVFWSYNQQPLQRTTNILSETINNVSYDYVAIPVVYLSSMVEYVSGNGSVESPFVINMN